MLIAPAGMIVVVFSTPDINHGSCSGVMIHD